MRDDTRRSSSKTRDGSLQDEGATATAAESREIETADRIRLSYRAADVEPETTEGDGLDEDHLVHDRILESPFLTYLRRVHGGRVAVGDEWSEFVNCGCGTTTDVVLRVESVEGGAVLGDDTVFDLVPFGAEA